MIAWRDDAGMRMAYARESLLDHRRRLRLGRAKTRPEASSYPVTGRAKDTRNDAADLIEPIATKAE
jgi:hypothetical protein